MIYTLLFEYLKAPNTPLFENVRKYSGIMEKESRPRRHLAVIELSQTNFLSQAVLNR